MRNAVFILVAVALLLPLTGRAIQVSGDQWGTWSKANNPYDVVGDVRVPAGSTLVLNPGVEVWFQDHYKFTVDNNATLTAVGVKTDSILFTCDLNANPNRWKGIRFLSADSDSRLSYCRIEYGKATGFGEDPKGGAIYCSYSSLTIDHSSISRNRANDEGGAIYLTNSSPTIRSNNVRGNRSSNRHGGAICCDWYSNPTVKYNTITNNTAADHGGGIFCTNYANPTIRWNIISQNSADGGGGVSCWACEADLSDNLISGNTAQASGGGICCNHIKQNIDHNTISGNSAQLGGGISCYNCTTTVSRNEISGNTASFGGGGLSCYGWPAPRILNNTFSGNTAATYGGAIFCDSYGVASITNNTITANGAANGGGLACRYTSNPIVTNTILWGDTATTGPEIYTLVSDPTVNYCDVQGGWSGYGNLNCDPDFVNPGGKNLELKMTSCCIDSGDPGAPLDPDGTRTDIGAFWFRQFQPATVKLTSHTACVILSPQGGSLNYDTWICNHSNSDVYVDVWVYAFVPGIGRYGPTHRYNNVRVRPHRSVGMNNISKAVPGGAPAGDYSYVAYIGDFGSSIIDSCGFPFVKLYPCSGKSMGPPTWDRLPAREGSLAEQLPTVPTEFALGQNYPNPFNAITTINYQLPAAGDVSLVVYNLLGERVATLVDETQEAGYKSVTWEDSESASGVYFYKLTTGDFTETRRMMLVK